MTAVSCEAAADRKADTWARRLEPLGRLEFAVSDAAKAVAKAVADTAAGRRDDSESPPLEHGLDVSHTATEANRVLARHWRRAEASWAEAEAAGGEVAASERDGIGARGVARAARAARAAWGRAVARLEVVERLESAWGRARAAPDLFGPDGRLNDRARAEAEIGAASKDLTGPDWAKVRNFLKGRRGLASLDRMHRRLESAEPRREWREAMAWRWWLLHRRSTAPDPLTGLARAAGRDRELDDQERASYDRVSAVLGDTIRASSAVGCINSVLRMQQSRHERMTQPMLDLKRLYWNCHPFRTGPRKDASPYQALGLDLPPFDFWALLQTDPGELTQRLSTARNEG
jgi:hypothetical protein